MKYGNRNNDTKKSRADAAAGLLRDSSGQVALEYLLVVSVIALFVTWAMVYALDDALQGFFDEIAAWVSLPFP